MKDDIIIRMAREAGWPDWEIVGMKKELKRFFDLAFAAGAAAERDACQKLCADLWEDDGTAYACAAAIRARK